VWSFAQLLPSFGNGAHFGFKHIQPIVQVLRLENKLKFLSSGYKNSRLNDSQAQLLSSQRRRETLFNYAIKE